MDSPQLMVYMYVHAGIGKYWSIHTIPDEIAFIDFMYDREKRETFMQANLPQISWAKYQITWMHIQLQ